MKIKKSFTLYHDYWDWLNLLTNEELGMLIRGVFLYEREKILPTNLDDKTEMAFSMVRERLDRDREKYESICNRNSETAKLRWKNFNNSKIDISAKNV